MNILGDFITRVNDRYPLDIDNEELNSLLTTIKNQGDELELKEKEISKLQNMLARFENKEAASKAEKKVAKKAAPKAEKAEKVPKAEKAETKPAAKKPAAKKAAPKKAE